jgi:hypothetical protein
MMRVNKAEVEWNKAEAEDRDLRQSSVDAGFPPPPPLHNNEGAAPPDWSWQRSHPRSLLRGTVATQWAVQSQAQ